MARYLILWELDPAHIPVDPRERGAGYQKLLQGVKGDIERGFTKAWGNFLGEGAGFTLAEGSEMDVLKFVQQYSPFVHFKTHPFATVDEVDDMINSMLG
jgi:hypothetical protein